MAGKPYMGYITSGISLASIVLYHTAKTNHPEIPDLSCIYPILGGSTFLGLLYSYFSLSKNPDQDIIEGEYRVLDNLSSIDKKI